MSAAAPAAQASLDEVVAVRPGHDAAASEVDGWLQDYATSRDPALRQRIILAYLGLADRLVNRYRHSRGTTPEDLRQIARAGLIAAVDRYDPTHGTGFVPFAVASVVGDLKRYLRDTSWRLHVPGHSKNKPCRSARRSTSSSSKPSAVLRPPASWPSAYRWPRSRCWRRWRSLDAAKSCPWTARSATTSRSVWVTLAAPAAREEAEDLLLLPRLVAALPEP